MATTQTPRRVLTDVMIRAGLSDIKRSPDTLRHSYTTLHLENLNVVDIGAIQAYPHLQQLFLDRNSLRSLSALEPLIHLTEVTATDNKLVGAFPDFVGARALERIDVSGNRFTSFSANLEKHSYLTHLTISRNELTSLAGLENLPYLSHFEANENRLTEVAHIENSPLVELRLRGNQIRNISHLGPLPKLKLLDLSDNNVESLVGIDQHHFLTTLLIGGNPGLVEISQLSPLQTLPRLAVLDLTGCPLQNIDHYRARVIYMLPTLTTLDGQVVTEQEKVPALNLHGDDVPMRRAVYDRFLPFADSTTKEAFERAEGVPSDPQSLATAEREYWLRVVDRGFLLDWEEYLTDVHEIFGIENGNAVSTAAQAVQLLDLAYVPLGDVGFYALAQALPELPFVQALQLKYSRHSARWTAVGSHDFGLRSLIQSLLTPLPSSIGGGSEVLNLKSLDLEGCELGRGAGSVLAELLQRSRTLRFLQLRNNRIGESLLRVIDEQTVVVERCPGMVALCAAAATSPSLLALDLAGNRIDDDGARCVAAMCASPQCNIVHLALGDNPIGIEGGITLATALCSNRSLRSLSLRGGPQAALAPEVAVELLRNLGRHRRLRALDVAHNPLGDAGAAAVAGMIRANGHRLSHLNIAGCAIGTDGMHALASALQHAAATAAQVAARAAAKISKDDNVSTISLALQRRMRARVAMRVLSVADNDSADAASIDAVSSALLLALEPAPAPHCAKRTHNPLVDLEGGAQAAVGDADSDIEDETEENDDAMYAEDTFDMRQLRSPGAFEFEADYCLGTTPPHTHDAAAPALFFDASSHADESSAYRMVPGVDGCMIDMGGCARSPIDATSATAIAALLRTVPVVEPVPAMSVSFGGGVVLAAAQTFRALRVLSLRGAAGRLGAADEFGFECVANVLAPALADNRTLVQLDVSDNGLAPAAVAALAQAAGTQSLLESLHIGGNHMDSSALDAIATCVQASPRLAVLNLAASALLLNDHRGDDAVEDLAGAVARLLAAGGAVHTLSMAQTDLSVLGDTFGHVLTAGLRDNAVLHTLELWQCELQDWPSLVDFCYSLSNGAAPAVTSLSVAHNRLGPASLSALGNALAANTSLRSLDMSGNQGGAEYVHALARSLQSNVHLRRLKLADAHPDEPLSAQEEALNALIEALGVNTSLAELHLGAAAAQGLSFELKRHVVETLAGATGSALGLITSNVELLYSDMNDLQHDLLDESELRALLEDSGHERNSAMSLTRRVTHIAQELNLPVPAVHEAHEHMSSPKARAAAANATMNGTKSELTLAEAVTQSELLLERRQQRQAAARERDLIENAWSAFLCRRRLQLNGRHAHDLGLGEGAESGAVFRTTAASLTPVQTAAACQLQCQPFPPLPGVNVDRAFEVL